MDAFKVVISILFAFSFLGILIAAYLFILQKSRLGFILGVIFVVNSAATFAYAMELSIPSSGDAFYWIVVRYISGTISNVAYLFFAINFSEGPAKFRTRQFLTLMIFPAFALLVLAINPHSSLLYYQIGHLSLSEIVAIDWLLPPLYILFQTYMSAIFAFQYFILFKNFRDQTKLNKVNVIIIASGVSAILLAHFLQMAGWRFMRYYNLTYFIFFPSAVIFLWGYLRFRLGDIRPIAYNSVFNQIREAILVLDQNERLVDFNPAAARILQLSSRLALGNKFDPLKHDLLGFPEYKNPTHQGDSLIFLNNLPYHVNNYELTNQAGKDFGYLITFRDISSQLEAENLRSKEVERNAIWNERRNVARILHDSIMQDMNSLIMLSTSAQDRFQQGKMDQLPKVLNSIIESARYASMEVKNLTRELQINEEGEFGFKLQQYLTERVEWIKNLSDTRITLILPEELSLSNQVQREFFYIILEALNNTIKHADAHTISVIITEADDFVCAEIVDDGVGFNLKESHLQGMGITNMRQRASLIGANFELTTSPGSGVRIGVKVAVQKGIF